MNNLRKMNVNENILTMINEKDRHLYLCFVAHFINTIFPNHTQSVNVLKKESILETVQSAMDYFKQNSKLEWKIVKLIVFETESDMHASKKPLMEFLVNYREASPHNITEPISLISFDTAQNLDKQLTVAFVYRHLKKEAQ